MKFKDSFVNLSIFLLLSSFKVVTSHFKRLKVKILSITGNSKGEGIKRLFTVCSSKIKPQERQYLRRNQQVLGRLGGDWKEN
jgi:hypothetical protein